MGYGCSSLSQTEWSRIVPLICPKPQLRPLGWLGLYLSSRGLPWTFLWLQHYQQWEKASSNTEAFFKPLLNSPVLVSCWPKQATWPSLDSKGSKMDSNCLWKKLQSHLVKGHTFSYEKNLWPFFIFVVYQSPALVTNYSHFSHVWNMLILTPRPSKLLCRWLQQI